MGYDARYASRSGARLMQEETNKVSEQRQIPLPLSAYAAGILAFLAAVAFCRQADISRV